MVVLNIDGMDLNKIANSGQCFRVVVDGDIYSFITGNYAVSIVNPHDKWFVFSCELEELHMVWAPYFDLKQDFTHIGKEIPADDIYMQSAAQYGAGIRILKQDLWETMCSFIISQNNNIPRIKDSIEKLCYKYGKKAGGNRFAERYTFPTAQKLATLSLYDLQQFGLGYRDKYILNLAQGVASGSIDLRKLQNMDDTAAYAYLKAIYGIGDKVAACILLYGLHRLDAFPVDTHIKQILLREYDSNKYSGLTDTKKLDCIIEDNINRYKGYRGYMQQCMFDYERAV